MPDKKGFTLIEVLVVVVVVAILALLAFASYKRARLTAQNEMARAKLVEVAMAAQMYNEDARGSARVAGGLGQARVAGFQNAELLFLRTPTDTSFSYLKNIEWNKTCTDSNSCVHHYRGYNFYVCNPDSNSASNQPAGSGCDGKMIAVMTGPVCSGACAAGVNLDAAAEYGGKSWWVSRDNLGTVGSNYGS
ncbi:MAG: prepilin-type N-terminal cleavage/methylation domain-containing protein [Elusimicrobiota bacterium]|jgi:prepilin-type N-terminal cleavage/methylation domain-containing protein|nr:prepilin-type N-terminal cleavage/methylation domain-containing protein [Elusimicrobiota bacterium]